MSSFLEQVRRNSVALISLVVAISSLGYNTWRNELTEQNRNIRYAGFETLLTLGELQRVVFYSHYDKDSEKGNPRTGWASVLQIRDLSQVLPKPMPTSAKALLNAWENNWEGLGHDDNSANAISKAIDNTRDQVLGALAALD